MLISCLLLSLFTGDQFAFAGGTPQKFTTSLSETFERPVFVSTSRPVFKAVSAKAEATIDLISRLETATDLASHSLLNKDLDDVVTDVILTDKVIASRVVKRDGSPSDSQLGLPYGDRIIMLIFDEGAITIKDQKPLNLGNWLIAQKKIGPNLLKCTGTSKL